MNSTDFLSYHPSGSQNRLADRRAALLFASALFIFGSFIGCALYRLLGLGESELYDNLIERYFIALFAKCTDSFDVFRVVVGCYLHEIWLFCAVFAGGFTLFTTVISVAALLYRGILFGFAITMLQFSSKAGLFLDSLTYIVCFFAISMLLCILAASAFGYFYPSRRPELKSPATRGYVSVFLKIIALVFANVCFMLFMIYIYI